MIRFLHKKANPRTEDSARLPLILHITHTDVRSDARIIKEVEALGQLRDVRVVALGVDRPEAVGVPAPPNGRFDLVRLVLGALFPKQSVFRYALDCLELALRMVPKGIKYRPAVVHCHDTMCLPVGMIVKLIVGSKLVYDAHELESAKAGQWWLTSAATRAIERICWSSIDLLISVSPSIIEWYQTNLGQVNAALIMNSPSLDKWRDSSVQGSSVRASLRVLMGIPDRATVFVYVGILGSGRGINKILEVFSRPIVSSHVVFLGYRDTVGVADWAKRCPNIHVHPPVRHDEVVSLIKEANCGLCLIEDVSLSDRLCLPNKLFEYAFAGVPVLASGLPEIERVVYGFGLGICCGSDVNDIEAAVRRIEQEGLKVASNDLAQLSWDRQADTLRKRYQRLLSHNFPLDLDPN